MPKEWSDSVIFDHPWELIVQAAYRKYPNPYNPHVKSLDTLNRVASARKLYSHRLFCTLWNVPSLVLKIVGSNPSMQINEQSQCDLETKTLVICARNLTLSHLFQLDEKLVYSVDRQNPEKTCLTQSAKIAVFGVPLFGSVLEGLLIDHYGSTVAKGRDALNWVAKTIKDEQAVQSTTSTTNTVEQ
ncbi:hypothetical protein EMCRGX_G031203 [Ephydatia muelleri]|eukprot:Em0018g790a